MEGSGGKNKGLLVRINRFEEIKAWQMAKSLVVELYKVTGNGPLANDYGLRDQIRRAGVSVMANIAVRIREGLQQRLSTVSLYGKGFGWRSAESLVRSIGIGIPEPRGF